MHKIPLIPAALLVGCCAVAGCGSNTAASGTTGSSAPAAGTGSGTCSYPSSGSPAKTVDPPTTTKVPNTGTGTVTMTLDGHPVVITVDRAGAPCTANSFESLARQGWYTNTKCWRLTNQGIWVLQCGDPTMSGSGGPGYTFADELATAKRLAPSGQSGMVVYPKGTVAMANAGANTNGSQFFIVYEDSPLAPAYTVFGHVDAAGLTAVQKVAEQGVAANGQSPNAPALIGSVTLG